MKIIPASYEIIGFNPGDNMYRIERAARTCYKSEDKMDETSSERIIPKLIESGHEAMLEHSQLTVIFTVDRGVSHELVRHRIASFAQESTRYCNYSKDKFGNEITVIDPVFYKDIPENEKEEIRAIFNGEKEGTSGFEVTDLHKRYANWYTDCQLAEAGYFKLLKLGATPQEARAVLPNSLKTEIVVTANLREWRHILKLRAIGVTGAPHPQMAEVMIPLLGTLKAELPLIFGDL